MAQSFESCYAKFVLGLSKLNPDHFSRKKEQTDVRQTRRNNFAKERPDFPNKI